MEFSCFFGPGVVVMRAVSPSFLARRVNAPVVMAKLNGDCGSQQAADSHWRAPLRERAGEER